MSKTLAIAALVAGLGMVGSAHATHTLTGLDWSLNATAVSGSDNTYLVTLGLDTDGYIGTATFLDQISLKPFIPITSASLVDAPSGIGAWNFRAGALDDQGCTGHGAGLGFGCLNSLGSLNDGKGLSLASSNGEGVADYSWIFRVGVNSGQSVDSGPGALILARLVDDDGAKVGPLGVGPINLAVSAVPEPGTYAMMLAGLGMIGTVMRRRCADTL